MAQLVSLENYVIMAQRDADRKILEELDLDNCTLPPAPILVQFSK